MNKEVKKTVKFLKKNKSLVIKTIIPVVIFCLVVTMIGVLSPKPNDNITPSNRGYLFENRNPTFNVGFGTQDQPDKSYVRFEAKVNNENPFEDKDLGLWDRVREVFTKRKGFEFGLSEVRFSEGSTDAGKSFKKTMGEALENMELESIFTNTEVIEVGRLLGEEDKDDISKETVINKDVYPGIDVEYQILEGLGVKEEIVIRNIDEYTSECGEDSECLLPLNEFVFDLKLDEGLQVKESMVELRGKTENKYYITDSENNYVAHFLPTFAVDELGAKTTDVGLDISHVENNNYKVTVILSLDWLFSSERIFPVRIDPSIVHDTTTEFDTGSNYNTEVVTGPKVKLEEAEIDYVDSNVVGYWKLDEGSGTGAYLLDSSGNGKHATPTGTSYTKGMLQGARDFAGSSSHYIDIPNDFGIFDGTSAVSLEMWVYARSFPATSDWTISTAALSLRGENEVLLTAGDSVAGNILNIRANCTSSGWANIVESTELDVNTWYHFVITFSPTNGWKLYQDSLLVDSSSNTETLVSGTGNNLIGGETIGTNRYWDGIIDEVRISNIARPADEIERLYRVGYESKIQGTHTSASLDMEGSSDIESITWTAVGDDTGDAETPYSTTNMVAQWDFNETSGTTADNKGSCGSSCDGTLYSMTTTGQDVVAGSGWSSDNRRWGSGALMFDGTNDYVSIPSNTDFRQSNNFSVEAWVNSDQIGDYQYIINHAENGGGDDGWGLRIQDNGRAAFNASNANGWSSQVIESDTMLKSGEWYHVVGVYDSSYKLKIYVNGKLENTKQASGSVVYSLTDYLNIGRRGGTHDPNANFFDGTIDSIRFYKRTLSDTEILSNYQAGNIEMRYRSSTDGSTWSDWSGTETAVESFDDDYLYSNSESNLVGYWPMDEESSTTVSNVKGTNNGTAYGSTIVDGKFGKSRAFDGTNDYVEISNDSSLQIVNNFTWSAWIYRAKDTGGWERVMAKSDSSAWDYFMQITNTDTLHCGVYTTNSNVNQRQSLVGIPAGEWTHVACNLTSSNTWNVYVNGALSNGTTSSSPYEPARTSTKNLQIGRMGDSSNWYYTFNGQVDEFQIHNTALTASQVHEKWAEGSSRATTLRTKSMDNNIEGDSALDINSAGHSLDATTVGYWKLDEPSGTGAYLKDSSSYGNDGTPTGTTYVKEGKVGGAREFNGTSDYISVSSSSSLNVTGDLTVETWIYPHDSLDSANSQRWLEKGDAYFFMEGDGDNYVGTGITFLVKSSNTNYYVDSGISHSANQWYYIVGVHDDSANLLKLYVNGVLVNTTSFTSMIDNDNLALRLGSDDSGRYFNGTLDEVRISNRVRSAAEIAQTYAMGRYESVNKSIASTDLSTDSMLPFWIASDSIGNNMDFTYGESLYANYESDENTVGLWHLDDVIPLEGGGGAEGGTISYSGGYTIHTFKSSGTFKLNHSTDVEYLVIAGGGAGGGNRGSGGGAGGYRTGTLSSMSPGSYTVTVGAGGVAGPLTGPSGGNSVFSTITSTGGGGGVPGGTPARVGNAGGSGSGGTAYYGYDQNIGGSGISGQGYRGGYATVQAGYTRWCAAGGGGAGSIGGAVVCSTTDAGSKGGTGKASSITGTSVTRASGGSGWPQTRVEPGGGGASGVAGTANTGGGGGAGASGGSGIVIVRYKTPSGGTRDSSGYMNDGTIYGDARTEDSFLGSSYSFDGTDDYISVSSVSGLSTGNDVHSIEMWIKPDNTPTTRQWPLLLGGASSGNHHWTYNSDGKIHMGVWGGGQCSVAPDVNQWNHIATTFNGTTISCYKNGKLTSMGSATFNFTSSVLNLAKVQISEAYFDGAIDEVRISNIARTPDEIRQTYEVDKRTHPIIVDFKADLESSNLITGSTDKSFTISEQDYGTSDHIENIDKGEKIVIKENYNGTEYIAQGDIDSVNTSTGAVTVSSWDTGSTFPTSGFTVNATVFKWQREYVDIRYPLGEDINAITNLTFRKTTDAPATFWIDDAKKATYSSDYSASSFTTIEGVQYVQYQPIFTKWDDNPDLDLYLSEVDITYTSGPTNEQLMRHGKWFDSSGEEQPFWWSVQAN